MTNLPTQREQIPGPKVKPSYEYEERPSDDVQGASQQELADKWGRAGTSMEEGRVTRRGAQHQQNTPANLEPSQDENEVRAGMSSLDQPAESGGDRRDSDQPGKPGSGRSGGLDPSSDVDRPEGADPESQQSSSTTEDDRGHSPRQPSVDSNRTWKRVERKRSTRSERSDTSKIEGDLLAENESDYGEHGKKFFPDSFYEDVPEEFPENYESEEAPRWEKVKPRKKSGKKHGDKKGKQPVRPVGFREFISSISRAGQGETVSRHKRAAAPTSVLLGRGTSKIPHGLTFNADKRHKARQDKNQGGAYSGGSGGGSSDSSESEDERLLRNRPGSGWPKGKPGNRAAFTPPSSPSTNSDSSESDSSSQYSSSDGSESSSDSDSGSAGYNRRHKRKHKSKRKSRKGKGKRRRKESKAEREERKALARLKVTPPSVYDGKADLAVFDKWTYEVSNWAKLGKYRDETALRMLVSYMSGEAGQFFMSYIAGYEAAWTLKTMYESLFDYCFPSDFKDRLRAKLSHATQGKRRIRDFVRDIEKLASRFPDVNERAIIQTFWNGMHQEIRLRLIEWGISAEHTPLKKIVLKAMDIEASQETYRRELQFNQSGPSNRKWGRFANRASGTQPWRPANEEDGPKPKEKKDKVRVNSVTSQSQLSNGEPSQ